MHLSDELETPRFNLYFDLPRNRLSGKYCSLPAHLLLPKEDKQRDYIRLVQIYPIVQEGF